MFSCSALNLHQTTVLDVVRSCDIDTIDPFTVDDTGVWFFGVDQEGKRKPPEWLCSRLAVEALTRDQDGSGEPRVDGAPGLGAACKAVDEHHGLAATAAPVADFVTVNDDARKRE